MFLDCPINSYVNFQWRLELMNVFLLFDIYYYCKFCINYFTWLVLPLEV